MNKGRYTGSKVSKKEGGGRRFMNAITKAKATNKLVGKTLKFEIP